MPGFAGVGSEKAWREYCVMQQMQCARDRLVFLPNFVSTSSGVCGQFVKHREQVLNEGPRGFEI